MNLTNIRTVEENHADDDGNDTTITRTLCNFCDDDVDAEDSSSHNCSCSCDICGGDRDDCDCHRFNELKHDPNDNKPESEQQAHVRIQKNMHDYIVYLCSLFSISPNAEVMAHFEDGDKNFPSDKNVINKIFHTQVKPSIKEEVTEDNKDYTPILEELKKSLSIDKSKKLNQIMEEAQGLAKSATDYYKNFEKFLEAAHKKEKEADEIRDGAWLALATEEFRHVLSSGFWEFEALFNGKILFTTKQNIIIRHVHEKSGVNIQMDMGKFSALYDFNVELKVYPWKDNMFKGEFFHPHVASDGNICWGDVKERVYNEMRDKKFRVVFDTLASLLVNYAEKQPYVHMADFKKYGVLKPNPDLNRYSALKNYTQLRKQPKVEMMDLNDSMKALYNMSATNMAQTIARNGGM